MSRKHAIDREDDFADADAQAREDAMFDALGGGPAPSDLTSKTEPKAPVKGRVRRRLERAASLPPTTNGLTAFQTAHPAVVEWLTNYRGNFGFYLSLKDQYGRNGHLSERQVESVYKAIERDGGRVEKKPVPYDVARNFDVWLHGFLGDKTYQEINHPIVDAFRAAIADQKPVAKIFTLKVGERLRVSKFHAKNIGQACGLLRPHFVFEVVEITDETAKAYRVRLKAVSQRSGHCCICGLTLTNPESVSKGIGPVCGDGYQLDWNSDRDVLLQLAEKLKVISSVTDFIWLPKSGIKERFGGVE